ncbi:MAG: hypothetical protein AMXMBFR52_22560 [Burkholderiales bacterium]
MRKSIVLAGALLALPASPAIAGRPFATEDAGVLAAGDCELEAYALRQTAGDSYASGQVILRGRSGS